MGGLAAAEPPERRGRDRTAPDPNPPAEGPPPAAPLATLSIFVVDDEPQARLFFIQALQRGGMDAISEISVTERPDVETWMGPQLIDTRDTQAVERLHAPLAVNIPADDLIVRARAALNLALPVFVDCRYDDQGRCRILASDLGDAGFLKIVVVLP